MDISKHFGESDSMGHKNYRNLQIIVFTLGVGVKRKKSETVELKKKKKGKFLLWLCLDFYFSPFFPPYKIPAAISVGTIFNSIRHSMFTFFLMQCDKAHL